MSAAKASREATHVVRDHLFISYAWEDGAVAEWLVRKLTAAGYKVWCDRFKILGGERWPRDIDQAIKVRTFRMLALMSRNSLEKENPVKERQLALSLSKERREEFLIPLNLDRLRPTDLGWELSDIAYIPFHEWAVGFVRLLDKLKEIDAPRPLDAAGPAAAAATFVPVNVTRTGEEGVYSNCFPVLHVPIELKRFAFSRRLVRFETRVLSDSWSFYDLRDGQVLAFTAPPVVTDVDCRFIDASRVDLRKRETIGGISSHDVVINLLKKALLAKCIERGLARTSDGHMAYFPPGLLRNDRLVFRNALGKRSWVAVLGERRFGNTRIRYQLGVRFRIRSDVLAEAMVVQTKVALNMTDPSGTPLDEKVANARRKKVTKSWWNHEWISRQFALIQYLANGAEEITVGPAGSAQIRISSTPLSASVSPSINDAALEPLRPRLEALSAAVEADESSGSLDSEL